MSSWLWSAAGEGKPAGTLAIKPETGTGTAWIWMGCMSRRILYVCTVSHNGMLSDNGPTLTNQAPPKVNDILHLQT